HGWFGTQQGSNHGFGNQVLGATDGNGTYKRFSSVNGQHVRHRCFLPSTPRSTLVAHTDRVALTNWQCPYCRRRNLDRSEEHTSELQSRFDLVCRLLLEKKNITYR